MAKATGNRQQATEVSPAQTALASVANGEQVFTTRAEFAEMLAEEGLTASDRMELKQRMRRREINVVDS